MTLQFGLLLLGLVSALIGTLTETKDKKAAVWYRRVQPWGWVIVGALVVSFALSAAMARQDGREKATKAQAAKEEEQKNVGLRANVEASKAEVEEVRAQLGKANEQLEDSQALAKQTGQRVDTLLAELGKAQKEVASLLEQLDDTQTALGRVSVATMLKGLEDAEMAEPPYLRLHFSPDGDEASLACHDDPFWFVPGVVKYEFRKHAYDVPGEVGFVGAKPAAGESEDARERRETMEHKAGHA